MFFKNKICRQRDLKLLKKRNCFRLVILEKDMDLFRMQDCKDKGFDM